MQVVGGNSGRVSIKIAVFTNCTNLLSIQGVHKVKELPKEESRREVERYLTGKETEPWELIYFRLYKSQLSLIEQALETAALMLHYWR